MPDTVTTSWRRLSDQTGSHGNSGSICGAAASPPHVMEAQPLEVWEDEGGKAGISCPAGES